jgi:type II secretory pathway pseudopilin PulG
MEDGMFEAPQEAKSSGSNGLWIGIAVIAALAAAGGYFLMRSQGAANRQATAGAALAAKGNADAVRDLKIQRTTMDKDRNGTASVWAVTIENKSSGYSYSNIAYETTYIAADGQVLMINKGTVADSIGPGEQKGITAHDPLYPAGTARYMMKITGATPAAQ